MSRRFNITVVNLSGKDLQFSGEWFESGGWRSKTCAELNSVEDPEKHADLMFESKSFLSGVRGVVSYASKDRSFYFAVAFDNPYVGPASFTAYAGTEPQDSRTVLGYLTNIKEQRERGNKFERCYWEVMSSSSTVIALRVYLLDKDSMCPGVLQRKVELAMDWTEHTPSVSESPSRLISREVVIDVDNKSENCFVLDGEWFECGNFKSDREIALQPLATTQISFSNESFEGVSGICWFVGEGAEDKYLSLAFSNPVVGHGSFEAWAGLPPYELKESWADPKHKGLKGHTQDGVSWQIDHNSSRIYVRLVVDKELGSYDASTYQVPGREQTVKTPTEPISAPDDPGDVDTQQIVLVASTDELSAEDADDRRASAAVDDFLNSSRPKHVGDGLVSGVKSALGGVVVGGMSLVAAPVVGAKSGGFTGFAKGLGTGVGSFVGLTVGGVVGGAAQVLRGIANTPEAIVTGSKKNMKWDKEKGAWYEDSIYLRDMINQMKNEASDDEESDATETRYGNVVDTHLYDVLDVAPTATQGEIKKAYYRLAVKMHPDKNRDNPEEATAQFQRLNQAFQILSDPALRARYDSEGEEKLLESDAVRDFDLHVFFNVLFGSEKFQPYIGDLSMAAQVSYLSKRTKEYESERRAQRSSAVSGNEEDAGDDDDEEGNNDFAKTILDEVGDGKRERRERRRQLRRELKLADALIGRLSRFVVGRDETGFAIAVHEEARELSSASFGPQLLETIGWVYQNQAGRWLAQERGQTGARIEQYFRAGARGNLKRLNMLSSVYKSYSVLKKIHEAAEKEDEKKKTVDGDAATGEDPRTNDDAEPGNDVAVDIETHLPLFLKTAWDMCVSDIEQTVRHVCKKVLRDQSVPWQIRYRRALALERMGRIFEEASRVSVAGGEDDEDVDPSKAKLRLEEALLQSLMNGTKLGKRSSRVN